MSNNDADGIRAALVDKKFLHSNSTSHEWMFGAIAELIDNASDPDVKAIQFWIDVDYIHDYTCLTFADNGKGMDTETLHRMLSFGFSDKKANKSHLPIGRYGNGFKSGSMRAGQDAIVFTRRDSTMSVGMLSQTYLQKIDAKTVLVPIVTWDVETDQIIYPESEVKSSLQEILKYSLFRTEAELKQQFQSIPVRCRSGTKIVIYNLARDDRGYLELDFKTDEEDIRLTSINQDRTTTSMNHVSPYRTSLRKYISILYLKPPMQIWLRNVKVKTIYMKKFLTNQRMSTYMPKVITPSKAIKILFGLNPDQDEFGMMMYNRNRLIQSFRKHSVPKKTLNDDARKYQEARDLLEQTIGVVELECLTPNHIKQNFQDDSKFRTIEANLTSRLWSYCMDMVEEKEEQIQSGNQVEKEKDLWVQCDDPECQKWRRLPFGTEKKNLPDKWYCRLNTDPEHNYCGAEEEQEDEPEIQKPIRNKRNKRNSLESPIAAQLTNASSSSMIRPQLPIQALAKEKPSNGHVLYPVEVPAKKVNLNFGARENHEPSVSLLLPPQLDPELQNIIASLRPISPVRRPNKRPAKTAPDIEVIPVKKKVPEIVTINDESETDDDCMSPDTATDRPAKIKEEPSEQTLPTDDIDLPSYSPDNQQTRSLDKTKRNKTRQKDAQKSNGEHLKAMASPVSLSMNNDAGPCEVPNGSLQPLSPVPANCVPESNRVEIATSPIPASPSPSLDYYEQEIANLKWDKIQLQKQLDVLQDELEHERSRAYLLEVKLTQLEHAQLTMEATNAFLEDNNSDVEFCFD